MALLFSTGFDWWDEDLSYLFFNYHSGDPNFSYITEGGRTQTDHSSATCGQLTVGTAGGYFRGISVPKKLYTIILGIGVKHRNRYGTAFDGVFFENSSGKQGGIKWREDGSIWVFRGSSTYLGTTKPGILSGDIYRHLEVKYHVDNNSGEVEIRCDGEVVYSGENLDTQVYTGGITWVNLSDGDPEWQDYDDIYILDESGSYNNDFIGHAEVRTAFVTASGEYTQWLPSSGENYECVDDEYAGADSDYLVASGEDLDQLDSYKFTEFSLPGDSPQFLGVNVWTYQYMEMSGLQRICHTVRVGSADYSGEMHYVPPGFDFRSTVFERDPSDDGAWTESVLNSAEFGVKRYKNT
jgi:hypothetical protein